jgi:glucoamylase
MGEQVWDADPIPAFDLYPGRPSGSAMPLVWAHAEFAKLALSLKHGAPVDRPQAVWDRYGGKTPITTLAHWMRAMPVSTLRRDQHLRFIFNAPTLIHWCVDEWTTASDLVSKPGFLGLEVIDIPAMAFTKGQFVRFSVQDLASKAWTEDDQAITLV